jgi:hypothetical protein
VATVDTTQQLAWEARQRPRAALAAILAAILSIGPDLWTSVITSSAPKVGVLDALANAARPGPIGSAPSLRTAAFRWIVAHGNELIGASAIKLLGFIAIGYVLTFLIAAARARRPEVARPVIYVGLVGALLVGVGSLAYSIASKDAASAFVSGPHTVDRAADAGTGSFVLTAQIIGLAGQFALGAGYAFVSLNAMRTGLLTKFMGILGVIIGILVVIPIGPQPVVQTFWLIALAMLFLGRWPSGVPPAWASGRAEPWPTQAEVAAKRKEAMDARRGKRGAPAAAPQPAAVTTPERAKRKRKRR